MKRRLVGKVAHYYSKIGVTVIELLDDLRVGDEILVEGATTRLTQGVESMEIEHKKIEAARKGQMVGLKVVDRVREGDQVYVVEETNQP